MHTDLFLEAVKDKKARLYHAAQLRDLRTYVAAGCVSPREELFRLGVGAYTPSGLGALCFLWTWRL